MYVACRGRAASVFFIPGQMRPLNINGRMLSGLIFPGGKQTRKLVKHAHLWLVASSVWEKKIRERLGAPNSSSCVSDQQSLGQSPGLETSLTLR